MNTQQYFDSACEIHVKHSVDEEYKELSIMRTQLMIID